MKSPLDTEAELCRHYQLQAAYFTRALQTCDQITHALRQREEVHEDLARLNGQLEEITALETATRQLHQRWAQSGQPTGSNVQGAVREVAAVVKTLIEHLDAAESLARQSRDSLRPLIHQSYRAHQVRQAYRQIDREMTC